MMPNLRIRKPGFGVGLILGILVAIVVVRETSLLDGGQTDREMELPFIPVQATATDSNDSFIVATGPIDEFVEGIFFLDPVTGELSCWVMSPWRQTFSAKFKYDKVADDLGLKKSKNSKLLMVTGTWDFRSSSKPIRPSLAIVYVVNSATGQFAAYSVPWNQNIARKEEHRGELRLVGKGKARTKSIAPS